MRTILVLALLLLPTAQAVISTTPTRLDVETTPDAAIERVVTVQNKGSAATSVEVHVSAFESEDVHVEPASFTLAPGERRDVVVRLHVAANTSGGRHDPRLEFIEVPVEGTGAAVGRAAVSVPLVFWVENLKLGDLLVRHDAGAPAASVRILAQNFLPVPAAPAIELTLLDAEGVAVASALARAPEAEPNASVSVETEMPLAGLAPGRYTLVARATHEGHESNALRAPLVVGKRSLAIVSAQSGTALGVAAFRVVVANDGDVPLGGTLVVQAGDVGLDAPIVPIPVGESRVVELSGAAPAGPWRALVRWDGGEAQLEGEALLSESIAATPGPGLLVAVALVAAALARRR